MTVEPVRWSRFLDIGVEARAPAQHDARARTLVHQLKYNASPGAARTLGRAMAQLIPTSTTAIVPVPRAKTRRLRYGVDPAYELALVIGRTVGVPVRSLITPAWWWPAHVGSTRRERVASARFRCQAAMAAEISGPLVLIDDVITTGGTVAVAVRVLSEQGGIDVSRITVVAATLA